MKKTITLILLVGIMLCLSAYAEGFNAKITYNYYKEDMSPLDQVKLVGYTCLDSVCGTVTDMPFHVNLNSANRATEEVSFPTVLSEYGYALYYFRSGYLPMEYAADWRGTGTASYDIVFPKMKDAKAKILSFDLVGDNITGNQVMLKATVSSAFSDSGIAPEYLVSQYLEEFYSSLVEVTFSAYDSQGQNVFENSHVINLLMDTHRVVSDVWTPENNGKYTIYVSTEVIDDQVISTIMQEKMLFYSADTPDNTGPEITLLSPADGELLAGLHAELLYEATDPSGILHCSLYLDGHLAGEDDTVSSGVEASFHLGPLVPKEYSWQISCTDNRMNKALSEVRTFIVPKEQEITDIECFPIVVAGEHQSCSVHVKAQGQPVEGALVKFYDSSDDSYLGSCSSPTDRISGGCSGMWIEPLSGERTIYATSYREGYINDTDKMPKFQYLIYSQRYDILDLKVYNESSYNYEDYDFYRNEEMYVKFRVFDTVMESLVSGIVTDASLVSSPGGRADLIYGMESDDWYHYSLRIPPTHEFLGDSQVFAFAFNFTDKSGGERWVPLIIRNNPPRILPMPDIDMAINDSIVIDLSQYESDIEDSGDDLRWELSHVGLSGAVLSGKDLIINPIDVGLDVVMLKLYDLDDDYDRHLLAIQIGEFVHPNRPPYFVSSPIQKIVEPHDTEWKKVYFYHAQAADPDGDVLVYSLVDYPEGMTIDMQTGLVRWKYDKGDIGSHRVTVRASDGEFYADQMFNLTIELLAVPEDIYPRMTVFIERLRVNGMPDDILRPGDQFFMSTTLENIGHHDISYVTVRATCEGLGISRKWGPYSGPEKDNLVRGGVLLEVPLYAEPGYYTCRTTIRTDSGLMRTRHRDIRII